MHHWDAVNAAGDALAIDPAVAADSVDEFLTVLGGLGARPGRPAGRAPLDGDARCSAPPTPATSGRSATADDRGARCTSGSAAADGPTVEASAADLLLWLYGRELDTSGVPDDLLGRFTALTFTD